MRHPELPEDMKMCSKCGAEKPVTMFGVDRHAKTGVTWACRACRAVSSKKWKKANPERDAARKLAWRISNTDKTAAHSKKSYEKHAESIRAKKRDGRLADPAKTKAIKAASYARCAAKNRATKAAYYRLNKDAAKESIKKSMAANPEKYAAHRANRKARKVHATPAWFSDFDSFVVEEVYELIARRRVATGIDWQLDHTIPIAGRTVCGLHVALNLQLLPAAMNNRKRNKHDPQTFDARTRSLFQGVTV